MTRIYTRAGDGGETGILGAGRVAKDDPRIQAIGAVDELNAALGLALTVPSLPSEVRPWLLRIQHTLFEAGASLASKDPQSGAELFPPETLWLEQTIDQVEAALPRLDRFILPGATHAGAWLHWARTVSRRAESQTVSAVGKESGRGPLLAYLNRLSDALFVFARKVNQEGGVPEVTWESVRRSARRDQSAESGG